MLGVVKSASPEPAMPSLPSANVVPVPEVGVWTLIGVPCLNAVAGSPSSKSMQKYGAGASAAQKDPPAASNASDPASALTKVSVEHAVAKTPTTIDHVRIGPSYANASHAEA